MGADEQVLIERALAGDQRAFAALYRRHHVRISRVVAGRMGDWDEAEDLVQMTFVRAFRSLERFRGEAAFATWLTRIALNLCHSHRLANQARKFREKAAAGPEAETPTARLPSYGEDPEESVSRKERQALVRAGLRSLPAQYRRALWLRYIQDRSYTEIVAELQVPMGTVKTWLCRGRAQLRGLFAERKRGPGRRRAGPAW